MDFLTEDILGYIPFIVCGAVLVIGGIVYLIVKAFKEK